jgi:capsular polysaccharide transport system permease protein
MSDSAAGFAQTLGEIDKHRRIMWALLMRELSTRYGRDDIGFLWVIAEPLLFASAVSVLWSYLRTPFENGIRIVPFVITGYLPLILVRQTVNFSVSAVKVNSNLLYHRQITPLHLFISRFLIEFLGVSTAFVVISSVLIFMNLMDVPKNFLVMLSGWLLLAWLAFGMALIMGALAEIFDFVERIVQIITYVYIPLSGAFIMAATLAPAVRRTILLLPFIHCTEMIRSGWFGEFITVYYNPPYVAEWAAGFTLLGLILVQFVRSRVEVE